MILASLTSHREIVSCLNIEKAICVKKIILVYFCDMLLYTEFYVNRIQI